MDKKKNRLSGICIFYNIAFIFYPLFLGFHAVDCLFLFVVNILCCCLGMYIKKTKSGKND